MACCFGRPRAPVGSFEKDKALTISVLPRPPSTRIEVAQPPLIDPPAPDRPTDRTELPRGDWEPHTAQTDPPGQVAPRAELEPEPDPVPAAPDRRKEPGAAREDSATSELVPPRPTLGTLRGASEPESPARTPPRLSVMSDTQASLIMSEDSADSDAPGLRRVGSEPDVHRPTFLTVESPEASMPGLRPVSAGRHRSTRSASPLHRTASFNAHKQLSRDPRLFMTPEERAQAQEEEKSRQGAELADKIAAKKRRKEERRKAKLAGLRAQGSAGSTTESISVGSAEDVESVESTGG